MSKGTAITWAQRFFLAALVVALLVFGLSATGSTASQLAFADGSAWLPTWELGEAVQVNSASGEVTARTTVSEPGRKTEIVQLGSNAAVLNVSTGEFGAVNGASLTYAPTGTAPKTSTLVGGHGMAYVVDPASTTVRPVDAETVALGDPNSLPAGPYSMASGSDGSLWIASIESGQVVAAQGDRVSTPRQVAPEGNTIALATVEKTPVILDLDALTAVALDRTTSAPGETVCLAADPIPNEGLQFAGSDHLGETALTAVLSPRDGDLLISDFRTETCARVPVGSLDQEYGPILVHHDIVFIPNWTEGKIVVVDAAKRAVRYTAQVAAEGSPLNLFVDDDQVWFNNPAGPEAGVVDENRVQNRLDKYSGTVLPTGEQVPGEGTISVVAEGDEAGAGSVVPGGQRPTDSVSDGGQSPADPAADSAPTTTTTQPEQPANSPDRPLIPEDTPDLTVLPGGTLDGDTSGETSSGAQPAAEVPQPAPQPQPEPSEGPATTTTTIPNQLVADFEFTGTGVVTVGDKVVFTDVSSGGPETWTWTFGDGSSSAGRTAGKTWSEPGIYDVVLTVSRAFETSQAQASIQVLPPENSELPQPPRRAVSSRAETPPRSANRSRSSTRPAAGSPTR